MTLQVVRRWLQTWLIVVTAASCGARGAGTTTPVALGPCGAPHGRATAALCGPPSSPCRVVADETIADASPYASLAVDANAQPVVVYRKDQFGYSGLLATRAASGWIDEPTPFPVGLASAAFDPAGVLHVLLNTGADSSLQYTAHDSSGWQPLSAVASEALLDGNLWAPGPGCLLAGAVERSSVELLQKDPSFSFSSLSADGLEPSAAVSANGRPELAWLDARSSLVVLTWQAPPDPAEDIAVPTNEQAGAAAIGVVGDAGGVGQPHLLYKEGRPGFESDPGTSNLVHAVRAADGTWSTATIAQDQLSQRCFFPGKPPPGTMCTSRNLVHTPVEVLVSDGGDVRLLYVTSDQETVFQVDANGQASSTTSTLSMTLDLAWPDGAAFGTTTLLDAGASSLSVCAGVCHPARALVDGNGTIHVLLVGPTLRYIALAP